ncbi:replication factor A protein, partial [Trifolium medium]|nr:replication factor A protein [Trifolium medium]
MLNSGKCECALFGDYVDVLNKKIGKTGEGLPVVVIQFAKVKIFRVKEKIHIRSIAVHGIEVETKVPVIGGSAKPSIDEEFLRMHPKKKVSELADMAEDGIFAVYGVVTAIVEGEDWWYPACMCHRSVIPDSGAYFCNGCSKHVFKLCQGSKGRLKSLMVCNDKSHPAEFQALVGKMLFIIEKGMKQIKIFDGTFRVKRVCFDSKIIETFCAEGPFVTPLK